MMVAFELKLIRYDILMVNFNLLDLLKNRGRDIETVVW